MAVCKVREPSDGLSALLSILQELDEASSSDLCFTGAAALEVISNVALSGSAGRRTIAAEGVRIIIQAMSACSQHPSIKETGFRVISHMCLDEAGTQAAVDAQESFLLLSVADFID